MPIGDSPRSHAQSLSPVECNDIEPNRAVSAHAGPRGDEVRIYLAGSVPKGNGDLGRQTWSEKDEEQIRSGIRASHVETLNPNKSGVSRADFYANFGCDLYLVASSDVVFVDGRGKRGIGVGAEMMFAQMRGVRVVAICPDESAYRRRDVENLFGEDLDEWIHPFVFGLTDHIAASLGEAISWLNGWIEAGRPPKSPEDMNHAISYYQAVASRHGPAEAALSSGVMAQAHKSVGLRRA